MENILPNLLENATRLLENAGILELIIVLNIPIQEPIYSSLLRDASAGLLFMDICKNIQEHRRTLMVKRSAIKALDSSNHVVTPWIPF